MAHKTPTKVITHSEEDKLDILNTIAIPDINAPTRGSDGVTIPGSAEGSMKKISDSIVARTESSASILAMFPEMKLAIQILTSSILAPKDMTSVGINVSLNTTEISPTVQLKLLSLIQDRLNNEYGLTDDIETILRNVLFEAGAHPIAIIPNNSLTTFINSGIKTESIDVPAITEELSGSKGYLAKSSRSTHEEFGLSITTEDIGTDVNGKRAVNNKKPAQDDGVPGVVVVDNYDMLKLPEINKSITDRQIAKIRTESMNDMSSLFRGGNGDSEYDFSKEDVRGIEIDNSKPTYKSISITLPPASVIPVFRPGNPRDHVGAFVLIDSNGYPISPSENDEEQISRMNHISNPTGIAEELINKVRKKLHDADNRDVKLPEMLDIYTSMVEASLEASLSNGIYAPGMGVSKLQDVYITMFARTLKNKQTRLVFIPEEYLVYYANEYYSNGTGKSLMDDIMPLSSLRAILMFSKASARVRNSIGITNVHITLDEHDPDPYKTIHTAGSEIMKLKQQAFPWGVNKPADLLDWMSYMGLEYTYSEHPQLPDTRLEFTNKSPDHVVPDDEMEEDLRKQSIMALGLTPEMVDNGFSSDFATTVVANNVLMAKRVIQIGNRIEPHLSKHIRLLCTGDSELLSELNTVMKNEGEGELSQDKIARIFGALTAKFPKPSAAKSENLSAQFDEYLNDLDTALESWVSSELLSMDGAESLSEHTDMIVAHYKAHYARKWMADNNYMTDLADIVVNDNSDNALSLSDISDYHLKGVIKSLTGFVEKVAPTVKKGEDDLEKTTNED